ncbi:MAG TPA: TolC family protein [bacterium]
MHKWIGILFFVLTAAAVHAQATLDGMVRSALENNPGLKAAKADVELLREDARQAKLSFLPSFDASGSFRHQSFVPKIDLSVFSLPYGGGTPAPFPQGGISLGLRDTYDVRMTVSQPLFTGFRLIQRKKMADAAYSSKRSEWEQKRNELIHRVESAYYALRKAKKLVALAQTAREQVLAHLRDVERFFEQGLVQKDEILKVRVKTTEAELALLTAKNAEEMARAALESAIGSPIVDPTDNFEELRAEPVAVPETEASIQTALLKRPEIRAAQYARAAAKSGKGLVRGGYFPSIAAFGTRGYGKPGLNLIGTDWMDYWLVGAGFEWNLFEWGKTRSQEVQAGLRERNLAEMENQLRDAVVLETRQACLKLAEASERLNLAVQMEDQARESFRVAENLYKQGQSSHTAFFDAQSDWTRAGLARAQAEIDVHMTQSAWRKAVGTSASLYP